MITKIGDFSRLNEALRLPHGYFLVNDTFMLPLSPVGEESSSSSVFNKGSVVEINTNQKYIKKWMQVANPDSGSKRNGEWKATTYPWVDLMDLKVYPEFKKNVTRLEETEVPDFYKKGKEIAKTFTTTLNYLHKRLSEYKLDPKAKIKITIL